MGNSEHIKTGAFQEDTFRVESDQSAIVVGSGGVPVLATPWLIAFIERVAFRLLEADLSEELSSVGTEVNIRHKAPSPIGSKVRVSAKVISVDGKRITLSVQAWDEQKMIAEGTHQRVIIDQSRFLEQIAHKD